MLLLVRTFVLEPVRFRSDSMAPDLSPGAMLLIERHDPSVSRQTVVMGSNDGHQISRRWSQWRAETDLQEYFTRWQRLQESGQSTHGEADFIEALHPASVLDAGCGMGRVAIELDRRGIDVVGVDLDVDLLEFARRSQPSIQWIQSDLATMNLDREFDVVAMPGNVMIFCRPSDRAAIVHNAAVHIAGEGFLVAGFELRPGAAALTLDEYDQLCAEAGLELTQRTSTWQGEAYDGGPYAVSVHRRVGARVLNPQDG